MTRWPVQLLVYAAGDGNSTFAPLDRFIERQIGDLRQVATNRYVSALLQIDNTSGPSERRVLDPRSRVASESIGETNTGDPNELVDFAIWADQRCPSDQLVLVLSGHGMAWEDQLTKKYLATRGLLEFVGDAPPAGVTPHARRLFGRPRSTGTLDVRAVLVDANARNGSADFLDNSELGKACARIAASRGETRNTPLIDVLVFDACLMSSWEILTEVSDSTSTVVAAFDEISAAGMNLAGAASFITTKGGAQSARELAKAFPESYAPGAPTDSCIAVDVAGDAFGCALAAWRAFAEGILRAMSADDVRDDVHRRLLYAARTTRFHQKNLADVAEIEAVLGDCPGIPSNIIAHLAQAVAFLRQSIVGRTTGSEYRKALGVSLFVPLDRADLRFSRPDYQRLRFTGQTGWDKVLDRAFAEI